MEHVSGPLQPTTSDIEAGLDPYRQQLEHTEKGILYILAYIEHMRYRNEFVKFFHD